MIHAIFESVGDAFVGCTVRGHAMYSARSPKGQVLCAAVSSAVQLTCNTLTECFHAAVELTTQPSETASQNQLAFRLTSPDATQSELLHGLLLHFQALAEDFPREMRIEIRASEQTEGSSTDSQNGGASYASH